MLLVGLLAVVQSVAFLNEPGTRTNSELDMEKAPLTTISKRFFPTNQPSVTVNQTQQYNTNGRQTNSIFVYFEAIVSENGGVCWAAGPGSPI